MNKAGDSLVASLERSNKETPEERFRRVATRRTNLVLRFLRLLGNTSGPGYKHTQEEVRKIFSAIRHALDQAESKFAKEEHPFSL
jgi:hypothetical protein